MQDSSTGVAGVLDDEVLGCRCERGFGSRAKTFVELGSPLPDPRFLFRAQSENLRRESMAPH